MKAESLKVRKRVGLEGGRRWIARQKQFGRISIWITRTGRTTITTIMEMIGIIGGRGTTGYVDYADTVIKAYIYT